MVYSFATSQEVVKAIFRNPGAASAGHLRDMGLISGLGRFPGGGYGSNSSLENPMDIGAWQATVHGIAKSQT